MRRFLTSVFLILVACQAGCSNPPKETAEVIIQTCEHCGAVYEVTSFEGEFVPETVEWCFNDGNICQEGLDWMIKAEEAKTEQEKLLLAVKMIQHMETCFGCKAAFFENSEAFEKAKQEMLQ